ncbi:MAG: anthranilate synthase component I family protein [Flavobacteriales bacterium]
MKIRQNDLDFVILPKEGKYIYYLLSEKNTLELAPKIKRNSWLQISYDLKEQYGGAKNSHPSRFNFPHFAAREILNEDIVSNDKLEKLGENHPQRKVKLSHRWSKDKYIEQFNKVQYHLQMGNIYEMNLCMEFYAENVGINPYQLFKKVNERTEAPFSCLSKLGSTYLICASPERFLKKTGSQLISQPIKGTAKRNVDQTEDKKLAEELQKNPKEQSENVMIVDLVRNDLSRLAKKGTVKVDELFGVQTFKTVHQLVSTVSCEIKEDLSLNQILEATFPMGSMTGAPKIRAMQLIDELESHKRELYSGAVGIYETNGNFDLNVVIRSFIYNKESGYLSLSVGSAVTVYANAEQEYEECLLKAEALMACLD